MTQMFCRHKRFIQRCPICRETVQGLGGAAQGAKPKHRAGPGARAKAKTGAASRPRVGVSGQGRGASRRASDLRVRREQRFEDDGYRCELVPGLHSSEDAERLAQEIGFAAGRLLALTAAPPSLFAEARDCGDIEQATWMCFLAAYLSPLQGEQAFLGIRRALLSSDPTRGVTELEDIPLGPRTSHNPLRGSETLDSYRRFAEHAGSQAQAFTGETDWTPQRRFERLFERLALPGFGRMGRYDLLVTLGRLGLYELRADSLHLLTRSPALLTDRAPQAAKRVFGIGDPIHIERRASALAQAMQTPIEALDLALYNWDAQAPSEERVTLGFPEDTCDADAVERARAALEV